MLRTISRRAFTMLEAVIAVAIFASVMAAIIGAMQSGSQMQTRISVTDTAGDTAARAIRDVASELRYADINRIYLDGTAWTTVQSGSDYYSFKVPTGFDVVDGASKPSFDRVIKFERGIVLRFSPTTNGAATLYRTVVNLDGNGVPIGTVERERPIATGLAWEYRNNLADPLRRGFQIVQLDSTQASVVGNRLSVHAAAFVGSTNDAVAGQRPVRAVETAVYLRSSMFDATGLSAPEITSPAAVTGNVGKAFIYDIVATNDPNRFAASSLPPGLTYSAFTGRISGTPTVQGTYSTVVSAFNESGSDAQSVAITIMGPAPTIISPLAVNITSGDKLAYTIVSDPVAISYGAAYLPSWLTFDGTAKISGTAPSVTTTTKYLATISATNANGTDSEVLTIQVSPLPPKPPVITTSGPLHATIKQPYYVKLAATDNPNAWSATILPSWLTLNKSTGEVSGTPDTLGTYSMTVQASNEVGTSSETTIGVIVQEPFPIITSPATAVAEVGLPFKYQITALNSPTSYKVDPLPTWLTLDSALGVISGTPTTAGTATMTLTAINDIGGGTAPLEITIVTLRSPTVSLANPLSATAGVLFSYTIFASPLVTKYAVYGLPKGLTTTLTTDPKTGAVTCTITGKPLQTGTFDISVTAVNAAGSETATTSLIVASNPALPVITLGADQDGGKKFQVLGTVAPGAGGNALTLSSLKIGTVPTTSLTLSRGWIASEAKNTTLKSNEFLLTNPNVTGQLTVTAEITDSVSATGMVSRTY